MAKLSLDMKNLPAYAKILIGSVPSIVIIVVVLFLLITPKHKEIKILEEKISKQEDEIAKNEAKAAKLPELTLENERLRKKLSELKQQLPEEKEVSTLLKQVSDLALAAGLKVSLWKPQTKKVHTSGIVYEIPVQVQLSGSYHSLGYFFSSLTRLSRIVNISDIKIADPKPEKGVAVDSISFIATTFSAIPEEEIGKVGKAGKGK